MSDFDLPPPPRYSRHRSRRLRKKLAIGEFRVLGFTVAFEVDRSLSEDRADDLFDRFISEAIEGNDLACGGGGDRYDMSFYVLGSQDRRHVSATVSQQQAVGDWLQAQKPQIVQYRIGPLADANYSEPNPAA